MINRLRIQNFAIIDLLDIRVSSGFNVLTGETGAGKSIIIDALGLLLGDRASQDLIRTGSKSAFVEGEFSIPSKGGVTDTLREAGWDVADEIIIGREISRTGKSHAFVNGRMVPVAFLHHLQRLRWR